MNISGLQDLVKKTQENLDNLKSGGGSERSTTFPMIYPGDVGSLKLRLFYSEKYNAIQSKQIARHDAAKGKVPCLQMYGEDCPVCNAISEVEGIKGEKCGVRAKYKAKNRWLCYAQLIDFSGKYGTRDNDPKKKDMVIFMYPIQVFKAISELIIKYSDNLDKIVAMNEAKPFIFTMSKKGAFLDYDVQLDAFGTIKSFGTDDEFEDEMAKLPNINNELVDEHPNEDVRNAAKALAESIRQEYINGSTVNPDDEVTPNNSTDNTPVSGGNVEDAVANMVNGGSNSSSDNSDKPDCFGHRDATSDKCNKCMCEPECYLSSL